MLLVDGYMVSHINYDYSEITSYFKGVYTYQGRPLDFTIVKTVDLETKDVIDLIVSFNHKIDNEQEIKDEVLKQFNKQIR